MSFGCEEDNLLLFARKIYFRQMLQSRSSIPEIILGFVLFFIALNASGCGNSASSPISNDSPTAAYKRLYAAVKNKDTNAIKDEMSKHTVSFVQSIAGQRKQAVEKVYENGLTGTTFSETLPPIRDERINNDMGALEVYNSKEQRWEDLPFVFEDGKWKLAVGEQFQGTYRSPGKGRDQKEKEAANVLSNSQVPVSNMPANVFPAGNGAVKNANQPVGER